MRRYPPPTLERGARDAARRANLDACVAYGGEFLRRCLALQLPGAADPAALAPFLRLAAPAAGDDADAADAAADAAAARRAAADLMPLALDRNAKVGAESAPAS